MRKRRIIQGWVLMCHNKCPLLVGNTLLDIERRESLLGGNIRRPHRGGSWLRSSLLMECMNSQFESLKETNMENGVYLSFKGPLNQVWITQDCLRWVSSKHSWQLHTSCLLYALFFRNLFVTHTHANTCIHTINKVLPQTCVNHAACHNTLCVRAH